MNSLIVFPEEITSETRAVICGDRAQYVRSQHIISEGSHHIGGIWNGNRGTARCICITESCIEFEIDFKVSPLERVAAALIVAVPRPQTVKKVIQAAASFGVSELHFVRTQNVVPSYLSSKTLLPDAIRLEVLKSLEQTCDTIPPDVCIHTNWNSFSSDTLLSIGNRFYTKVVADTASERNLPQGANSLAAAIGPESGWTKKELEVFESSGFIICSLGSRILRVEHAVAKLLSALA